MSGKNFWEVNLEIKNVSRASRQKQKNQGGTQPNPAAWRTPPPCPPQNLETFPDFHVCAAPDSGGRNSAGNAWNLQEHSWNGPGRQAGWRSPLGSLVVQVLAHLDQGLPHPRHHGGGVRPCWAKLMLANPGGGVSLGVPGQAGIIPPRRGRTQHAPSKNAMQFFGQKL